MSQQGCALGCFTFGATGVGYLAAATLTTLNPLAGAYFGLGCGATTVVIDLGSKSVTDNPGTQFCCSIAGLIPSVAAGLALTAALGFAITMQAAATLAIALIVTLVALSGIALALDACVNHA